MGLIVRMIVLAVITFFVTWATPIAYSILDPVYLNVIDPSLLQSEFGTNPAKTVMFFTSIGLIGIVLVLAIWAIGAVIASDIRQSEKPL